MKMKLVGMLMLAITMANAQENVGVRFLDNTFKKAQEQAKTENKMIFVDCYTPTCGPCKAMLAKEFPKKEMGDYLNGGFVPVKMDISVGEGAEMNKQWGISAVPTFLFMNSDGEILYRMVGYKKADVFIDMVKKGLADNTFQTLKKRYEAGERSAAFIQEYMNELERMRDRKLATEVANEYLNVNMVSIQTDTLVYRLFNRYVNDPYNDHFMYVYQHQKPLVEQYGEPLKHKLWTTWLRQGSACADYRNDYQVDEAKLNEYKAYMDMNGLESAQQIVDYLWLIQAFCQQDYTLLWKMCQQYAQHDTWVVENMLEGTLEMVADKLTDKKDKKILLKIVGKRITLLENGKGMEAEEPARREKERVQCLKMYLQLQERLH